MLSLVGAQIMQNRVMIDLRSDTQTKPSAGCARRWRAPRSATSSAARIRPSSSSSERAAAFLGQEEAVYLPTATMANQIALAILGVRGTELIVEETAHIMVAELGGAAMHSGLQTRGLPGYRGRISRRSRSARRRASRTASTSRAHRSSRSRTRTTARAARSGRSTSCALSSRPRASSASACTSTARGSRTRRSRSVCPPRSSGGSSTRSRSASRRGSAARSAP